MLLPLVFVLLCGCTSQKEISPVLIEISFTTQITYCDTKYVCDASLSDDKLNLLLSEPQEICGLSLEIGKDKFIANYMGLSYEPDIDSLPSSAVAQIMFNVINDATSKTFNTADQNCEIFGMVDDLNYIFTFSPSGLPLSLKIDDINFTAEFSNVTLK